MKEQEYYAEIEHLIKKNEIGKRARKLEENQTLVETYWQIGKIIVEAQGGSKRAKYGNELIKNWSIKLVEQYGKGYDYTNLTRMRNLYLVFEKLGPAGQLFSISWTHWRYLLPIKNENERNYYINQCILNNLSKRELIKLIKEKAFDRLSYDDKENIKLIDNKDEPNYSLKDMLLDPIIIKVSNKEKLSEKMLKKYIIEELRDSFLQLGAEFLYAGNEYKISYLNKNFYIDMLLFNTNLNCYIPVGLKLNKTNYKDVSQIKLYMNLVDKTLKKKYHNKTIGLIISKENDKFILQYVNDEGIYLITYELNELIKV